MNYEFYCTNCKRSLFAESAELLASRLNHHNRTLHPTCFDQWTVDLIRSSVHFAPPILGTAGDSRDEESKPKPLPQYTKPHGVTSKAQWGGAKEPVITEADKKMLTQAKIRWE